MFRHLPLAGVASFTLHFFVVTPYSLMATNSSCTSTGADGCSCQDKTCEAEGPVPGGWYNLEFCDGGTHVCFDRGDLTSEEFQEVIDNGFENVIGETAKICSSSGALVGGGCNHGTQNSCVEKITVRCTIDGVCEADFEEVGLFDPCEAIE